MGGGPVPALGAPLVAQGRWESQQVALRPLRGPNIAGLRGEQAYGLEGASRKWGHTLGSGGDFGGLGGRTPPHACGLPGLQHRPAKPCGRWGLRGLGGTGVQDSPRSSPGTARLELSRAGES